MMGWGLAKAPGQLAKEGQSCPRAPLWEGVPRVRRREPVSDNVYRAIPLMEAENSATHLRACMLNTDKAAEGYCGRQCGGAHRCVHVLLPRPSEYVPLRGGGELRSLTS